MIEGRDRHPVLRHGPTGCLDRDRRLKLRHRDGDPLDDRSEHPLWLGGDALPSPCPAYGPKPVVSWPPHD
jgi:hypothetical protein